MPRFCDTFILQTRVNGRKRGAELRESLFALWIKFFTAEREVSDNGMSAFEGSRNFYNPRDLLDAALIRMYNSCNAYSFLETAASIVKLGLKDPQKHLQRRRNMRDAASVVEMLSALPYQQVKGGECVAERRARAREERWGVVREPGRRKGKETRAKRGREAAEKTRRAGESGAGVRNTFRFLPSP